MEISYSMLQEHQCATTNADYNAESPSCSGLVSLESIEQRLSVYTQ